MADDKKTPATPSLNALKRMGQATEFYEQNYREEALPKARNRRAITNGVKVAKTGGSGITAMAGVRPGSGDVTLYSYAGVGSDVESTGVVVTISNLGKAVAANIFVSVADGDGGWWVVVEPCP